MIAKPLGEVPRGVLSADKFVSQGIPEKDVQEKSEGAVV